MLAEVLYGGYLKKINQLEHEFLAYDIISKVLIVIYLKLHVGMDNLPYLVNIPKEVVYGIKEVSDKIIFK